MDPCERHTLNNKFKIPHYVIVIRTIRKNKYLTVHSNEIQLCFIRSSKIIALESFFQHDFGISRQKRVSFKFLFD